MPPRLAAAVGAVAIICSAAAAAAQAPASREWDSASSLELIRRAIDRRTAQLADTGLADYRALAHGYVTFFGQLGEGFPDPPAVIRADELAVEVYWRAPNRSKQRVVGRRAELLRPTDIAYHADHLAIVQNNFPAIIRLGDGDEVRDVPHPLSPAGPAAYEFALSDSLTIRVAGRAWDVVAVDFRPRDGRLARAVGTAYIDRATASVVRLSVAFTRAALIDPALEDVSVVLDNGLVGGRFWLPRRQEIEIRRSGVWLDFPARGIIRGEWDLCCIEANGGVPADLFAGPEVVFASPSALAAYPFGGRLADSIPAVADRAGAARAPMDVQERAARLVGADLLRRTVRPRLSARAVSDFVRVNRVEGLALGAGSAFPVAGPLTGRVAARYGLDDGRTKYRAALRRATAAGWRFSVAAFDEFRSAGDVAEASTLANSIAAQEFGADATDEYRSRGVALAVERGSNVRWLATVERVRESPLSVRAVPHSGTFRPAFAADTVTSTAVRIEATARNRPAPGGFRLDWSVTALAASVAAEPGGEMAERSTLGRLAVEARATRSFGGGRLELWGLGAAVTAGHTPAQAAVLLGGPVSGPGYDVHSVGGQVGGSGRAEWQVPVTTIPVNLGRFGRTRVGVTLAPYAGVLKVSTGSASLPSAWRRSVGVGVITLYDALRMDVARGVDAGGRWTVRVDFGRAFWPVL